MGGDRGTGRETGPGREREGERKEKKWGIKKGR